MAAGPLGQGMLQKHTWPQHEPTSVAGVLGAPTHCSILGTLEGLGYGWSCRPTPITCSLGSPRCLLPTYPAVAFAAGASVLHPLPLHTGTQGCPKSAHRDSRTPWFSKRGLRDILGQHMGTWKRPGSAHGDVGTPQATLALLGTRNRTSNDTEPMWIRVQRQHLPLKIRQGGVLIKRVSMWRRGARAQGRTEEPT